MTMETPPSDVGVVPSEAVDPPPVVVAPPRRGGLVEWIWRGRTLAEARASDDSSTDRDYVRLVCEIVEVADRLSGAIDPPRQGSGYGTAILLYREALAGAMAAVGATRGGAGASFEEALRKLFGGADDGAGEIVASASALFDRDVSTVARLSEADRRREAESARRTLHAVIQALAGATMRRRRVLAQRVVRTGMFGILLSAVVVGVVLLVARLLQHPNFLERATMRTSSDYSGFSRDTHISDGRRTRLLFHTNKEDNAFAEFDMGVAKTVTFIELVNRHDCCDDRALPLAVEVSPDGKEWKEVFRRSEPFSELRQKIGPIYVRTVRVRALKKTWLHLERVAAW
jgi:hypothetical protein